MSNSNANGDHCSQARSIVDNLQLDWFYLDSERRHQGSSQKFGSLVVDIWDIKRLRVELHMQTATTEVLSVSNATAPTSVIRCRRTDTLCSLKYCAKRLQSQCD